MSEKKLASVTGSVPVVEKGEKGATIRPHESAVSGSFTYMQGGDGEAYIDVLCFDGKWYMCTSTYTTSSPSATDGHWKIASNFDFVATKLLLAEKSYIKNLGVDNILITDQGEGKGNVLLRADKDGITCKTGTFENVNISNNCNVGDLLVTNGLLCYTNGNLSYKLANDHFEYTDVATPSTLYGGKDGEALLLSLSTDKAEVKLHNGDDGIGVYTTSGYYKGRYTPFSFTIQNNNSSSFYVSGRVTEDLARITVGNIFIVDDYRAGRERSSIESGIMSIECDRVNNTASLALGTFKIEHNGSTGKTIIDANGIPLGSNNVSQGQIYHDSQGNLKVRIS